MAVISYIFMHTQEEQAVPAPLQKKDMETYAQEKLEVPIEMCFTEEDATLKTPLKERFTGKKMVQQLSEGDHLLVYSSAFVLNSASDGLRLLKYLAEKGVALHCLDLGENISLPIERKLVVSDGVANLVRKLLQSLAAIESSEHGESIRAAKMKLKQQGRYLGGPVPFGYQLNNRGSLVQKPAEQKIIREMVQLRKERWSYRDVATKIREKHGIKLSHGGVRKILERDSARAEGHQAGDQLS